MPRMPLLRLQMNKNTIRLLKTAALAVPFMIVTSAFGQMRSGNDGHALDANNRIGSNGINHPNQGGYVPNSTNDIVYGNVSGLNYFHGRLDTTDPTAFRGGIQTNKSDFLARTAGPTPTPD